MKKIALFSALIFISSVTITYAQTLQVNGNVSDQKGKPIAFAFISDSQHAYATFSDSSGNFGLKIDPASRLIVTAKFHTETRVKPDNPTAVKVVLADSGSNAGAAVATKNIFVQDASVMDMTATSLTLKGSHQEDLHGSRFLFNDWVHGFAITPKDSIKQNDLYLFNYDKISGNILFTRDRNSVFQVVKDEVKLFTFYDDNLNAHYFEDVPAIDKKHYVEVLSQGSKYKIYKNLGTKLVKADFVSDGINTHGHNYDEYVDEGAYYVVTLPAGQPVEFSLKKKSIKTAFAADAAKVTKYLSDNDGDIDDNYIKALGDALNQ